MAYGLIENDHPIRANGGYARTEKKVKGIRVNLQEIVGAGNDGFKELLREVLQEVPEQEMTEAIGAGKGEGSPERLAIARATIAGSW